MTTEDQNQEGADESADSGSNGATPEPRPLPRLLQRLRDEIRPQMVQEFNYTSVMQVPRLDKVVLNTGMGEALVKPPPATSRRSRARNP